MIMKAVQNRKCMLYNISWWEKNTELYLQDRMLTIHSWACGKWTRLLFFVVFFDTFILNVGLWEAFYSCIQQIWWLLLITAV